VPVQSIAIIPARGGSKAIPGKNVKSLAGRPLVAHTIVAARAARRVEAVYVSTDSPQIAEVAQRFGAEVIWRPAELSGDSASSESALLHSLGELETSSRLSAPLLTFLQCTSPLTRSEDIDGAIEKLEVEQADTCLAVTRFHYFLWGEDATGARGINHDKSVRELRQQRTPQYLEAGSIYVMKVDGFRAAKHRFFGKTALFEVPPETIQEIDDPVDFDVAELKLGLAERQASRRLLPKDLKAIAMDFDGVFTDNTVYLDEAGREQVRCHRGDGLGLELLRQQGYELVIVSKEKNQVAGARARKLMIPIHFGVDDKLPLFERWLAERGLALAQSVYVGNDVNDVECLRAAGCGVAVADAHPDAKAAADLILTRAGGRGALRELSDLILSTRGSKT
jgi:YrbI family 3-deoxy-D-manno-octulosonate 8-phosphate phosphatase